jgi:hypothetical protein
VTAGRGGLHDEVGHTCFQTSNLHAADMVHVSECIIHPWGGGSGGMGWWRALDKQFVVAKELLGMRALHSVQACIGDL